MSVVATMAALARVQHGLAHRAQLRALGVSDDALKHAVQIGELHRRMPEVYAIAGAPTSWRQELLAALLDAGEGAAVSHRAAAKLLSIAHRDAPEIVEISVDRPRTARLRGVVVHRSRDLTPEHITVVEGIPCTGALRTLVDLGAVERWTVVSDCLERALQARQVTLPGAEWMLTTLSKRGRTGCGVFRRVLDTRALKVASPHPGLLEPRMARVLAGLRLPEYQHRIWHDDRFIALVDFAYPDRREAFEVDGFEAHGTPDAMTSDFERDHRLRAAGWNVTHFSWHQVVRRPSYVAGVVARILGAPGGA